MRDVRDFAERFIQAFDGLTSELKEASHDVKPADVFFRLDPDLLEDFAQFRRELHRIEAAYREHGWFNYDHQVAVHGFTVLHAARVLDDYLRSEKIPWCNYNY